MNTLYFQNNGYFDPRAMLTAGVSAKEGDSAIGFFGTGFKYAAAIILRLGGHVDVTTKRPDGVTEYYRFYKVPEVIRGEVFDLVKVDRCTSDAFLQVTTIEAGFTTRLGLQWEPWMAYRELRCNATDEGGRIGTDMQPDFQTTVAVACPLILDAHANRSVFFIEGAPLYSTPDLDIFDGPRPYHYYRGVAVLSAVASAFSFNVKAKIELSEERTARYSFQISNVIERVLRTSTNRSLIRQALRSDAVFDKDLNFCDGGCYSGTSKEATSEFREEAYQALKTGTLKNNSARSMLERIRDADGTWEPLKPNKVQAEQMGRAIRFLGRMGFPVADFPIRPVQTLGEGVMGRAHKDHIYIAELAFAMGTKQVASTLLEEWVHLKHSHDDFDRGMQNWLFDTILSLGENINGEPL